MTGPMRMAALKAARFRPMGAQVVVCRNPEGCICNLLGLIAAVLLVVIACWPPMEVYTAGAAAGTGVLLAAVIHFVRGMLARVPDEAA